VSLFQFNFEFLNFRIQIFVFSNVFPMILQKYIMGHFIDVVFCAHAVVLLRLLALVHHPASYIIALEFTFEIRDPSFKMFVGSFIIPIFIK